MRIRDERRYEDRRQERGRHDPRPRKECRHDATTGPNRRRSTPDPARTHAAVAVEAQGAPEPGMSMGLGGRAVMISRQSYRTCSRCCRCGFGPIDRVIYHLDEWPTAPAKFATGGRAVRLADSVPAGPTPSKSSAQPQKDRFAGGPAPHRPRPRTRQHDGRGGPEQRLDRRRSPHGRRARQGNPHPDSCRARALGIRRGNPAITGGADDGASNATPMKRPASHTADNHER